MALQEKYAQLVVDIETLNKQMQSYLNGVNEYNAQLLPQLTEVIVLSFCEFPTRIFVLWVSFLVVGMMRRFFDM